MVDRNQNKIMDEIVNNQKDIAAMTVSKYYSHKFYFQAYIEKKVTGNIV